MAKKCTVTEREYFYHHEMSWGMEGNVIHDSPLLQLCSCQLAGAILPTTAGLGTDNTS